jgi:hypothetical protein
MGIGHVAAGLALSSAGRRVNAGLLIFAALLSDFLLGWFVLAGWESYRFPPGFASKHYMLFTFPWSHGLFPVLLWSVLLALAVWALLRQPGAAFLVALAVASHFLLDGLVHIQGLPIAGGLTLGLGLWRHLPAELSIEAAMALAALVLYWKAARDRGTKRRIGMAVYIVLLAALMIGGQAAGGAQPPDRGSLIASWIAAPLVFAGIAAWLDRRPTAPR